MTTYDHVTSAIVRDILNGDASEGAICQALTITAQCLKSDTANEFVDYDVLDTRQQAYEDADFCWNEKGDAEGTIECLRQYWSI
jgi:hypothetical protein